MAFSIPKKIGKYDVIDVIGKGGMGIVYRARDPFLDRTVAIKIMTINYSDSPDLLQRFYREAKATANLQPRSFSSNAWGSTQVKFRLDSFAIASAKAALPTKCFEENSSPAKYTKNIPIGRNHSAL